MAKTLVTSADGRDWWGCECLRQWWPLVTRMAVKRGLVKTTLDVTQGGYNNGNVPASADTHNGGGVLDLAQTSDPVIRLLREMGAAAWHRTPAQRFSHHTHMVLIGCPHVSRGAADQVDQYRGGTNGLVGYGPDDGPRVRPIRSWDQGLAWAKTQLDPLKPSQPVQPAAGNTSPTKPSSKETLPMDQKTFNALMTNWAKSPEGRSALAVAAMSATYGRDGSDKDKLPDSVGSMIADIWDKVAKR